MQEASPSNAFFPVMAMIGAVFIGAIMGIFARQLDTELNVAEQVALRSFMGGVILYLICFWKINVRKFFCAPKKDIKLTILRSLCMFVAAISLGTIAFVNGNYTTVAVIMALPVPAFLASAMFGEQISTWEKLLVTLAFIGAVLVISARSGLSFNLEWPLVCAVFATCLMTFGVMSRKWQSPFLNSYETNFMMLMVSAFVMGSVSIFWIIWTGNRPDLSSHVLMIGSLAGAANIGFLLLTHYGIAYLKGVVINNLFALQPLFGAMIGLFIFDESLNAVEWFGCILILISMILISNLPAILRKTRK